MQAQGGPPSSSSSSSSSSSALDADDDERVFKYSEIKDDVGDLDSVVQLPLISWTLIENEFNSRYAKIFLGRNAKAHFDFLNEIVDGAKERWRPIQLLDAVLCAVYEKRPTDHRSSRRVFEHHECFQESILKAMESAYDEAYGLMRGQVHSAASLIKGPSCGILCDIRAPWSNFTQMRNQFLNHNPGSIEAAQSNSSAKKKGYMKRREIIDALGSADVFNTTSLPELLVRAVEKILHRVVKLANMPEALNMTNDPRLHPDNTFVVVAPAPHMQQAIRAKEAKLAKERAARGEPPLQDQGHHGFGGHPGAYGSSSSSSSSGGGGHSKGHYDDGAGMDAADDSMGGMGMLGMHLLGSGAPPGAMQGMGGYGGGMPGMGHMGMQGMQGMQGMGGYGGGMGGMPGMGMQGMSGGFGGAIFPYQGGFPQSGFQQAEHDSAPRYQQREQPLPPTFHSSFQEADSSAFDSSSSSYYQEPHTSRDGPRSKEPVYRPPMASSAAASGMGGSRASGRGRKVSRNHDFDYDDGEVQDPSDEEWDPKKSKKEKY